MSSRAPRARGCSPPAHRVEERYQEHCPFSVVVRLILTPNVLGEKTLTIYNALLASAQMRSWRRTTMQKAISYVWTNMYY